MAAAKTADTECFVAEHNLREVHPNLFISDMTIYKSTPVLKSLDITNVLIVTSDEKISNILEVYRKEGISFYRLSIRDSRDCAQDTVLVQGLDYIEKCLKINRKIVVYGVNDDGRSLPVVMCYLMTKLGMTFEDARRQIGPHYYVNEERTNQYASMQRNRWLLSKPCCLL
jgi:hypothetical protein